MDKQNVCVGVILSGGAGTRMGGLDKGLQTYRGRTLIEQVIDRLSSQVPELIIVANRHLDEYREFGHPVIRDSTDGYKGPLAGVIAAIEHLKLRTEITALLIVTCDVPDLPEQLYQRLWHGSKHGARAAVANDGSRNQPLHCLIPSKFWNSLDHYFANGGRSMHGWQTEVKAVEVDFSDLADCFININRLDQIQN